MAKRKSRAQKQKKGSSITAPAPSPGNAGPSNFSGGMSRDATRTRTGTLPSPVRPSVSRGLAMVRSTGPVSRGSASITRIQETVRSTRRPTPKKKK